MGGSSVPQWRVTAQAQSTLAIVLLSLVAACVLLALMFKTKEIAQKGFNELLPSKVLIGQTLLSWENEPLLINLELPIYTY